MYNTCEGRCIHEYYQIWWAFVRRTVDDSLHSHNVLRTQLLRDLRMGDADGLGCIGCCHSLGACCNPLEGLCHWWISSLSNVPLMREVAF